MFKYSDKFYSNFSGAFEALGNDFPVAGDEELFELSKDFIKAVDEDETTFDGVRFDDPDLCIQELDDLVADLYEP